MSSQTRCDQCDQKMDKRRVWVNLSVNKGSVPKGAAFGTWCLDFCDLICLLAWLERLATAS